MESALDDLEEANVKKMVYSAGMDDEIVPTRIT